MINFEIDRNILKRLLFCEGVSPIVRLEIVKKGPVGMTAFENIICRMVSENNYTGWKMLSKEELPQYINSLPKETIDRGGMVIQERIGGWGRGKRTDLFAHGVAIRRQD